MESEKEFTFNYKEHQTKSIDLDTLDAMADAITHPGTTKIAWIITVIKLVALGAYMFMRSKLVDEKMRIAKQDYQIADMHETGVELHGDNLDEA